MLCGLGESIHDTTTLELQRCVFDSNNGGPRVGRDAYCTDEKGVLYELRLAPHLPIDSLTGGVLDGREHEEQIQRSKNREKTRNGGRWTTMREGDHGKQEGGESGGGDGGGGEGALGSKLGLKLAAVA
ncbi:hypothetical protein PIB30_085286 [Stylosanthes scabra]|uniref:Uncharacterized protein n=1 Tax=Stylosanthes scabra TaxID=79078 RepID=A0ABU6YRP9_9FABA|nr:hypothetical protein [Stylosanthes scabra]